MRAMRSPAASLVVLLALVPLGCDPSPSGAAGSASASAATSAPTPPTAAPTASAELPKPPDDLDPTELKKLLKCGADAKTGPCGVLVGFGSCSKWSASVPSGDGRWIGRGWLVEDGKTAEQFTILRARRVPTSEVGPGQLGVKIGIAEIPKEEKEAFGQADRALRPLERHDVVPKGNLALEYLKKRTDWPEAFATQTAGGQVYAVTRDGAFLCQGAKQQILLVQRAGSRKHAEDGVYAELWATTW